MERLLIMSLTSRLYSGSDDLERMRGLLQAIKRAHPYSGIHIGELDWWMFYDRSGVPLNDKVRLWFEGDKLIAWTWTHHKRGAFDFFIHPAYRGTLEQDIVLNQTVDALTAYLHEQPRPDDTPQQIMGYVDADDSASIALLEGLGFARSEYMTHFAQDIRGELPAPMLPDGFMFLDRIQPSDVEQRVLAHVDAFQPHSQMTPDYYHALQTAPNYDPELDISVVAPDGMIVSFAMSWIDTDNKLSVFEPVGTRYDFHRRGLGKATLLEGLRRLQARGVETALVSCASSEAGNVIFYQSVGFQIVNHAWVFKKKLM